MWSLNEKIWKKLFNQPQMLEFLEHFISELMSIDYEEVHNNIVVDADEIVNNEKINYKLFRPFAFFISFQNYIIIFLKNDTLEKAKNPNNAILAKKVADEFSNKIVVLLNLNFYD